MAAPALLTKDSTLTLENKMEHQVQLDIPTTLLFSVSGGDSQERACNTCHFHVCEHMSIPAMATHLMMTLNPNAIKPFLAVKLPAVFQP